VLIGVHVLPSGLMPRAFSFLVLTLLLAAVASCPLLLRPTGDAQVEASLGESWSPNLWTSHMWTLYLWPPHLWTPHLRTPHPWTQNPWILDSGPVDSAPVDTARGITCSSSSSSTGLSPLSERTCKHTILHEEVGQCNIAILFWSTAACIVNRQLHTIGAHATLHLVTRRFSDNPVLRLIYHLIVFACAGSL
jgi:uncharacterized membrane protein